jgi:uncharacterized membrane protein YraQ (UPF0718 family)
MSYALWIITALAVILSFIKDKNKSLHALKIGAKKFLNILPLFLVIMAAFAISMTFIPSEALGKIIGKESGLVGVIISLSVGSISVMPGFAAYPMGAALKMQGIPYFIIAGFVLSLMNVGIVSFPLEQKFLGTKVAIIRNLLGLFVSILVLIIIKLIFNE